MKSVYFVEGKGGFLKKDESKRVEYKYDAKDIINISHKF